MIAGAAGASVILASVKTLEVPACDAMQIAASTEVTVVSVDDVDKDMLERERQIELQKPDLQSKPENIRCAALWHRHRPAKANGRHVSGWLPAMCTGQRHKHAIGTIMRWHWCWHQSLRLSCQSALFDVLNREKMVEGRLAKLAKEQALLEQVRCCPCCWLPRDAILASPQKHLAELEHVLC